MSLPIAVSGLYDMYAAFVRMRAVYAAHGMAADVDNALGGMHIVYDSLSHAGDRAEQ